MTKQVTFLKDPELIKEYLEDECLNEFDLYIFQLIKDGIVKESDYCLEDTDYKYYEFVNDYIGLYDGFVIYHIGSNALPELKLVATDDDFFITEPLLTILKIESEYK